MFIFQARGPEACKWGTPSTLLPLSKVMSNKILFLATDHDQPNNFSPGRIVLLFVRISPVLERKDRLHHQEHEQLKLLPQQPPQQLLGETQRQQLKELRYPAPHLLHFREVEDAE